MALPTDVPITPARVAQPRRTAPQRLARETGIFSLIDRLSGVPTRAEAALQLDRDQLAQQQAQFQQRRNDLLSAQRLDTQLAQSQQGLQQQRLDLAQQQFQWQQDQAAIPQSPSFAEAWLGFPGATIQPGFQPMVNPYNGQRAVAPLPGTPKFQEQQAALQATERAVQWLAQYEDMVEQAGTSGTEFVGELANAMRTLRGQIEADILVARNFGAPQAAELQRVEQAIPDPTGLFQNLAAITVGQNPMIAQWQKDRIKASIKQQRAIVERTLRDMYTTGFYLTPTPGVLAPSQMEGLGN